jgi:hypothetical protein
MGTNPQEKEQLALTGFEGMELEKAVEAISKGELSSEKENSIQEDFEGPDASNGHALLEKGLKLLTQIAKEAPEIVIKETSDGKIGLFTHVHSTTRNAQLLGEGELLTEAIEEAALTVTRKLGGSLQPGGASNEKDIERKESQGQT